MRLHYDTREGKFNLMSPSEVSYSTHIAVYDDDGTRLKSCNISPESDIEGTDPEEAVWYIEDQLSRSWSTSDDDRKAMVEFLKEHEKDIITGNHKYELQQVNKKIDELTNRKQRLEEYLKETK